MCRRRTWRCTQRARRRCLPAHRDPRRAPPRELIHPSKQRPPSRGQAQWPPGASVTYPEFDARLPCMRRAPLPMSVVGAALAAALMASPARANGRFPRAQHLVESPSDPNRLAIAATFGLLTTSDRGKSWYHVCERAFSFQDNYGGDPLLALTADESMLVGVESSLNVSHDHGCAWAPSLQTTKQTIADFTVARSNADTIVAVVTSYPDGGTTSVVNESLDGGKTWKTVGTPLPAELVYSVDVDPKDPTHIYATGLHKGAGVFLYSSDHAMNWASTPIPNTNLDEVPYIAAIHPQDPKKIFVRT